MMEISFHLARGRTTKSGMISFTQAISIVLLSSMIPDCRTHVRPSAIRPGHKLIEQTQDGHALCCGWRYTKSTNEGGDRRENMFFFEKSAKGVVMRYRSLETSRVRSIQTAAAAAACHSEGESPGHESHRGSSKNILCCTPLESSTRSRKRIKHSGPAMPSKFALHSLRTESRVFDPDDRGRQHQDDSRCRLHKMCDANPCLTILAGVKIHQPRVNNTRQGTIRHAAAHNFLFSKRLLRCRGGESNSNPSEVPGSEFRTDYSHSQALPEGSSSSTGETESNGSRSKRGPKPVQWREFFLARAHVRKQGFRLRKDFKKWASRPEDVPHHPDVVYEHTGWSGWHDFMVGDDTLEQVNGKESRRCARCTTKMASWGLTARNETTWALFLCKRCARPFLAQSALVIVSADGDAAGHVMSKADTLTNTHMQDEVLNGKVHESKVKSGRGIQVQFKGARLGDHHMGEDANITKLVLQGAEIVSLYRRCMRCKRFACFGPPMPPRCRDSSEDERTRTETSSSNTRYDMDEYPDVISVENDQNVTRSQPEPAKRESRARRLHVLFHARHCRTHALSGEVDVIHIAKCMYSGCQKNPSFGPKGGRAIACMQHRLSTHVSLNGYRCRHPEGCEIRASFGPKEVSMPLFCAKHCGNKDIQFTRARCTHVEGCYKQASFRSLDDNSLFCAEHRHVSCLDLVHV
jgi:hypothetical protein